MCACALQVLIYPKVTVIDECSLKSYQEYKDGPVLDQRLIDWSVIETSFLFQRLSMLIQRFNSALITDSFCFADEDPDL